MSRAVGKLSGDRRAPTKGDRQRETIVAAVRNLLATESFSELSIAQITERAGITRSGFYFYFDSKYTVLAVLVARISAELTEITGDLARAPGERLADYGRRMLSLTVETWRRYAGVLEACHHARRFDPRVHALLDEWVDGIVDRVFEVVDAEVAAGTLVWPNPNGREVVRLFTTMAMSAACEASDYSHDRFGQMMDVLTDVWLVGLAQPTSTVRNPAH